MRKSLKRILTAALSALAFVAAGFGVSALKTVDVVKAEGELAITGRTLNVSNNVNVVFMIKTSVGDAEKVKVVAQEVNAVDGTEEAPVILSATGTYTDESTGTVYDQYIYKGVEAKEMPNVVYAYAYHVDNPTVLSATRKFSIIEYAHTSLASGADSKLEALIKATLDYGEAAAAFENQTLPADYLNDYKLWELDESTNATFADGFDYSYVYVGEVVNLKPTTGYMVADGMDGFTKNEDDTYSYTVSESLPDMSGVFVEDEGISAFDKVTAEKESLTLDFSEVIVGTTKELPTETSYPGVSITWSGDGVTDNSITFNTVGSVTLTATISCEGTESQTREFTITVKENPYPVEGKAYALKTTGQYAIKPTANNYLSVSTAENEAESFYFKKVDDVYYIYYMLDETSIKYVEHSSSTALKFVDATVDGDIPSTCKGWTLDVDNGKIISNVDSNRKLGYNKTTPRFSTYITTDSQYPAVWFEEIKVWTDAEKVQYEVDNFVKEYSTKGGQDLILSPQTDKFEASITWDLVGSYDCVESLKNGVLKTTNPAEEQTVTVNATITLGEVVSESIPCTIKVEHVEEGGNEPTSYSYTFTEKQFSANGTKTLNGVNWTVAGDGGYWGLDNSGKGQQFGSGGAPYKSLTVTSAEFKNVSKIVINTSGASSIAGSCKVYVGDTEIGTITLTAIATEYSFDVTNLTGEIKFVYTQTSSKAIYIKSITVDYAE